MKSTIQKLCDLVAPRDHAGRGDYDNDTDIPPIAWVYAALFILGWIGFQSLAHGAGFN
ncbi:hypothetical protein [Bordetella bronchialis]|uniref:hypothetical protein n=1 Tax=Bordetella bronchialis TaxID=463025 RepID=UPI000AE9BAF3|nr:hypothetical protein [Bordetella bronchialis]